MTPTPIPSEVSVVGELSRGIYVASKVAHAELWRDLRHWEKEPIISTWIDEAGVGESASLEDLWRRCVHEASNAGALIIYRRPDEVLKGAWVELGAALASGVPVFAVGIEEFTVANHAGITHCANLIEARRRARAALSRRSLETADGVDKQAFDAAWKAVNPFHDQDPWRVEDFTKFLSAYLAASRTPSTEVVVKAFVADYLKSDGTTDYYVMLGSDGREMSLHMHRIRGRAEYEAAEINHVISGSPKPEFDDFDVDGPALASPPSPAQTVTDEQAEAVARAHYDARMDRKGAYDDATAGTKAVERVFAKIALTAALAQPSKGA